MEPSAFGVPGPGIVGTPTSGHQQWRVGGHSRPSSLFLAASLFLLQAALLRREEMTKVVQA